MFVLSPSVEATHASASAMPGALEDGRIHPVPEVELPGPVRPEAPERFFALVDDDDLPALVVQPSGHSRAHSSDADDEGFHAAEA